MLSFFFQLPEGRKKKMFKLFVLLVTLTLVLAQQQSNTRCTEGQRRCAGRDKTSPLYYKCTSGNWVLYTCGATYTCSSGGTCVSTQPPPTCQNGDRKCVGTDGLYYKCNSNSQWVLYTCGAGYRCQQTSKHQATCQPNRPRPACREGQQRCMEKGNGGGGYWSCANGQWKADSCRKGDRCIDIPGGIINCQVGGGGKKFI